MTESAAPQRAFSTRRFAWAFAALAVLLVAIAALALPRATSDKKRTPVSSSAAAPLAAVSVEPGGLLLIDPKSALWENLHKVQAKRQSIKAPLFTVSGYVLAHISPGSEPLNERWRFNTAELSTTFADWQQNESEVQFARSQLQKTKELVDAENNFLETTVKQLEPLLASSSIPGVQLRQAKADLLKAQIQGEKDMFAAQSALRNALNDRTAFERDLSQHGIEPVVFSRSVEYMVLVVANVPESRISQVRDGQACEVQFFGYPNHIYPAHVESFASLVSHDRRTLRVLFELSDPENILLPGMFGDVGLGTEPRETMLLPAEAVLHIGRGDYVLMATNDDRWKIVEVTVGEVRDSKLEVVAGLTQDATVIADGAILLKPMIVQALTGDANVSP